jgi:hypothetical protein
MTQKPRNMSNGFYEKKIGKKKFQDTLATVITGKHIFELLVTSLVLYTYILYIYLHTHKHIYIYIYIYTNIILLTYMYT